MKIQIIAVGNRMPTWIIEGTNEYLRRFPPEFSVSFCEIAPNKRSKTLDLEKIKELEGEKCISAIGKGNRVIALEVLGKQWSTKQLATEIEQWKMDGRNVSLLIGGPEGLSEQCRQIAQQQWSLSPLTLPHPMVRVIVTEALYRAYSVTQNHPYHRE